LSFPLTSTSKYKFFYALVSSRRITIGRVASGKTSDIPLAPALFAPPYLHTEKPELEKEGCFFPACDIGGLTDGALFFQTLSGFSPFLTAFGKERFDDGFPFFSMRPVDKYPVITVNAEHAGKAVPFDDRFNALGFQPLPEREGLVLVQIFGNPYG
jgi:hypothetical protein